jgi:hypothetical protein
MTAVTGVEVTQKVGTRWWKAFLGGSKEAGDEIVRRRLAHATNPVRRDNRRFQGQS